MEFFFHFKITKCFSVFLLTYLKLYLVFFFFLQIEAIETISSLSSSSRNQNLLGDERPEQCVWYDICDEEGSFQRYCPVNHTAKEFPDNKLDALTKNCPHLLEHKKDGKLNLCCNSEMVSIANRRIFVLSGSWH